MRPSNVVLQGSLQMPRPLPLSPVCPPPCLPPSQLRPLHSLVRPVAASLLPPLHLRETAARPVHCPLTPYTLARLLLPVLHHRLTRARALASRPAALQASPVCSCAHAGAVKISQAWHKRCEHARSLHHPSHAMWEGASGHAWSRQSPLHCVVEGCLAFTRRLPLCLCPPAAGQVLRACQRLLKSRSSSSWLTCSCLEVVSRP